MESVNSVSVEKSNEIPQCDIDNEEVSKSKAIENEKPKDSIAECSKEVLTGAEDEDVELSEAEAGKDFGGNIDEDELLKDTEGEENCNVVSESSGTLSIPQSDIGVKGNVDSTNDKCTNPTEEKIDGSAPGCSNIEDGMPDSSNDNLENQGLNEIQLSEKRGENECSSGEIGVINKAETLESETTVTSSNNEPNEKISEISSQGFSDINNGVNDNSNSFSDEIEDNSLNSKDKPEVSKAKVADDLSVNIDDESNEKTTCESENQNKNDSCDGTKFLHVEQENSRTEESFEPMETGGEDPFAQTSDVAMDTSESSEKEGDSDKSNAQIETPEIGGGDKTNKVKDLSENVDKEKDSGKEISPSESVEKALNDDTSSSQNVIEAQSGATHTPTEAESNICESSKSGTSDILDSKGNEDTITEDMDTSSEGGNKKNNEEIETGKNEESQRIMLEENISEKMDCDTGTATSHKDVVEQIQGGGTEQETSKKDSGTATSTQKYKAGRPQGVKNKRKSSSEDSDSDIDIAELYQKEPVPKRTPKRSAAKRAESQIKVLSQMDKEIKEQLIEESVRNANYKNASDKTSLRASEGTTSVETTQEDAVLPCFACKKVNLCKVSIETCGKINYFCNEDCLATFQNNPVLRAGEGGEIIPPSTVMSQLKSADIQPMNRAEFVRKCSQCFSIVNGDDEKTLSWETMDFCHEDCLGKYQTELGSHCANCKGNVLQASLGKYCVRFGYEVKQFCCSTCLEEFKKGLKVCSFCQKDISSGAEGFLAPVGDKGTFKDFCTPACMEKYELMSSNQPPPPQMHPCDVCTLTKQVEFEVFFESKLSKLCSDICFSAYKFANKLTVDRCDMCKKYFDKEAVGEKFNIFYEGIPHNFCCKTCMNVYILAKRKIVPCNWCKVKKYNFDMIKRVQSSGQVLMMCSLNCLTLYQVSVNAVSTKRLKCDMCNSVTQAQYHLTMSDATIRNFCCYPCVMNFQQQYSKSPIVLPGGGDAPIPIPTGAPKKIIQKNEAGVPVPVISSVTSLANGQPSTTTSPSTKPSGKLNLVARLCEPPTLRNKFTQTRPVMNTKSVSCRPHSISVETQTEEGLGKALIPVPVPIYVPCPMAMYSLPFPCPVPFPLPIPVPIFLPTTRNSIKGIMKEIKRIQEKVPEDPFEAELLMMAEMVAEDKPQDKTSSDSEPEADNEAAPSAPNSDGEGDDGGGGGDESDRGEEEREYAPETEAAVAVAESTNAFGDDIMQMALKMATELDTPATGDDMQTQLPSNNTQQENSTDGHSSDSTKKETRGRKRPAPASRSKRNNSSEPKKRKSNLNSESSQPSPSAEEPKPDAHMKLKFTFGVNAWKSWVTQKNLEIEKLNATSGKKLKTFKTDMLQLTTDELNFSLCLFIKEVKKPNGTPYAPDTIYYLCLGIQQYLFENGRIDNIFTDSYFETFTDALDEVAKKFSELFNDHHYIVTRVEEEHLWESKQLGAHSPHVLLSTLMFFNTKHFNLTTVDEHLLLSFSHIMKHWKRNQNQSGGNCGRAPGSRNVLLRFYPPQNLVDDPNLKKKKVYEQQENEENPLRCPVKLYEFYLSKCPESVKNRNDVFYLQPERSCVPDSPVWYSTMALQREPLEKMLNRVKMVKEINVALLVA